ncbi:PREDICTED: uncharacterized protein LOC109128393 [Camelina sativa]|uniref:Uncharacterized protein LOC109128393 n=1 Tax=Camelina sativa TaxID=90675 RepID=A0ABM1QTR2_CAMSA|nr:PREDICTED: uncharacterized protein LOC109128393 [Camelina sativa]
MSSLLNLRPLAKTLIRCQIGDGTSASFWFDRWSPLGPLIDLLGDNGPVLLGIPINAQVVAATNSHGWRLPSSRSRNPLVLSIQDHLLSVPAPSLSYGPDQFLWEVDNRSLNSFSTKKTWNQLRPSKEQQFWAKAVWFKHHVPKHAFTFWVANLDKLPVRSRLLSWGMQRKSGSLF